jgi:hypothetical protein
MKANTESNRQSACSIMNGRTETARGKSFHENQWGKRHGAAWDAANYKADMPAGLVLMLRGWAKYADAHRERYESGVVDCGVMGPAWEAIGKQLREMLNGELGDLDAGTLDSIIGDILFSEGVTEE